MDIVQVIQCSNIDFSGIERLAKIISFLMAHCFCINHDRVTNPHRILAIFFSGTNWKPVSDFAIYDTDLENLNMK